MLAQRTPALALDGDGDFVIAWVSASQDGSSNGVFARRFNATGAGQAVEFQVNTVTLNDQSGVTVAVQGDGDFLIAWGSSFQDGNDIGVFARRFDSAGAALASEFQVNAYTSSRQAEASAAVNADGDFVIVWSSNGQDGSHYGVFGRRFDASGAPQATEFQVNTYVYLAQSHPDVDLNGPGDFVVAWSSSHQDIGAYGVFGQRFDSAGTPQAAEFQINSYVTSSQLRSEVVLQNNGGVIASWQSLGQDGSANGIFARRFSAANLPLATEFQVNTYTSDSQFGVAIDADAEGDFVIAWQSNGQDSSGGGVFAQRFGTLAILDIDGSGTITPLTDGLLVLRFLFGFTGATLTAGAVDAVACSRCSAGAIEGYLQTLI
jgi:hypothetical protein